VTKARATAITNASLPALQKTFCYNKNMPYHVGEQGSYGCAGYPAVKDDGTVMGCHETQAEAEAQIFAINQSEGNIDDKGYYGKEEEKQIVTSDGGVGIKNPQPWPGTEIQYRKPKLKKDLPDAYRSASSEGVPAGRNCSNCIFYEKSNMMDNKAYCTKWEDYVKADYYCDAWKGNESMIKNNIQEGDYVMGMTSEGIAHGRVEHIMWEGGILGEEGTEYALESMPPENPAMSVRIYEQEDEGYWEPTAYSIGMMYLDAQKIESLENHRMPEGMEDEYLEMSKAETYSPNDGMKSAAQRALKWKKEGKATGAGTPVGWGRATDIVAGRPMSLSVVKRMYSFFSRHEVDKKGKDFYNTSNPSNGRIMWDAWGGDAGFTWSRAIVRRNEEKMLFSSFGKDYTKAQRLTEVFKADSVRVGQMVSWNSSGGRATGKVRRIISSGSYNVPGTDFTVNGTEEDPAVVITLYRDGKETDTTVAHRRSTLRVIN